MSEFQVWLLELIDKHAGGRYAKFARLIKMSDAAVGEWVKGRSKPSKRGCYALARSPYTTLTWVEIGEMAESRYIGGVGNGWHETDDDPPEDEPAVDSPYKAKAFAPVFPKCDGCDKYADPDAYCQRRVYYCRPLTDAGLPPLCFEWPLSAVMRVEWMLGEG